VIAARSPYVTLITLIALAACGCGTSQSARFYTLDANATPDGSPPVHTAVMVGPITIPAADDQLQFVTQVASIRVDVDDFNRSVAPLNDNIARVVAGDQAVLLGTSEVATAPMSNVNPA
jgi:uncharacterized protein